MKRFYARADLVLCPDCGFHADASFGDHCGECASPRTTAIDIIRAYARGHDVLSSNELRAEFDRAGVKETARGPAFAAAVRAGFIRAAGHVPSTGLRTKAHDVKSYVSLIRKAAA